MIIVLKTRALNVPIERRNRFSTHNYLRYIRCGGYVELPNQTAFDIYSSFSPEHSSFIILHSSLKKGHP